MEREFLLKYSRHINLPQIDIEGQQQISQGNVLIIGLGGLGCAAAQYLVASGVGSVSLIDADTVDISNLHRQVLHYPEDIGKAKVQSASEKLKQQNPDVDIKTFTQYVDAGFLNKYLTTFDVVLDCSDNFETRCLSNTYCYQYKIPLVSGAAIRMEGQLITFEYNKDEPCYACLSHYFGAQNLSCVESGVLSPVVGVIGNLQAIEALLLLSKQAQKNQKTTNKYLLIYDAAICEFNKMLLKKNPECEVCQSNSN